MGVGEHRWTPVTTSHAHAENAALRVLWLCGVSPHGVESGLAMYTRGLTEALAASGCSVHGVAIGGPPVSATPVRWTTISAEPRSRRAALFSALPYIASRLAVSEHRVAVERAIGEGADVVVIDHLMSGWCLSQVEQWRRETGGSVVHVSHNHETKVRTAWARSESRLSPLGLYLRMDARRIARLEAKVMGTADLVTTITLEDRRSVVHDVEFSKSMVLTPGWDRRNSESGRRSPLADRERRVVLLGSLDWQAKRDNVTAVTTALDALFDQAGIELFVAGGGDEDFVAAQHGKWKATTFLGSVDDVDELLASCRVGLVAEPVGGGFKLKALDYGYSGLPIAVLEGSMAGLDLLAGRDVIGASTLEGLGRNIVDIIDSPHELEMLADRTKQMLGRRFEWLDRGRKLADRLSKMAADDIALAGGGTQSETEAH